MSELQKENSVSVERPQNFAPFNTPRPLPFWSNRIWDMYVSADFAFIKEPAYWTVIASRRFYKDDGKWYGL